MSLFQYVFPMLFLSYVSPFKNPLDLGVNDSARLFDSFIAKKKTGTSSTANPLGSSLAASCRVGNVLPASSGIPGQQFSNSFKNNTKQQRNSLDLLDQL